MNEKNQKIIGKVIKRLLSKNYPEKMLKALTVLEDYTVNKQLYYEEDMIMKAIPFLKETGYNFRQIQKLRKGLRQELIEQINARAEAEVGDKYNIGILILALKYVSHGSEGKTGLHMKNNQIRYGCFFIEKMESACGDAEALKLAMKTLKLI